MDAAGKRDVFALHRRGAINVGAPILEEGYALRLGDLDMIEVSGPDFPAVRGARCGMPVP